MRNNTLLRTLVVAGLFTAMGNTHAQQTQATKKGNRPKPHISKPTLQSLTSLPTPKLAGPALTGGLIAMKAGDDYMTKSTIDFDVSGIASINENGLIGKYENAVILDMPPRRMWGWGGDFHGYCGETSFQMSGLHFGNWVSTEPIRYAAKNKELLIGDTDRQNDTKAAEVLKYTYESFSDSDPNAFVTWVKKHIDAGHPVILGWYQYHKPDEDAQDGYDHIMPIIGYTYDTNNQVNGLYFCDLYLKNYSLIKASTFAEFKENCIKSRSATHKLKAYKLPGINGAPTDPTSKDLPDYAVGKNNKVGYELCAFTYAIPKEGMYAMAITGLVDTSKGELFSTTLSVDRWHEPDWGAEDKKNEKPVQINLTATVYGLTPNQTYTILRFDPVINKVTHTIDTSVVPTADYAKGHFSHKVTFTANSPVQKVSLGAVNSDGAFFYRTVKGTV